MNKPVDDQRGMGSPRPQDQLEQELDQLFNEIPAPSARRDRALFVAGVGARKPKPIWQRALVPVMGVAIVFVSLSVASLKAAPGQALWSVRNALNSVGIARPVEIVDKSIRAAEADVERADDALDRDDLDQANRLANRALEHVGAASIHLEDLSGEQREEAVKDIEDVRDDVDDIDEALREEQERNDSSGPGSGSDDDSDSSGKGSGSDGSGSDDSSGSGSGGSDDSGSDDSSGPGSGGSGSDDSSGEGSD